MSASVLPSLFRLEETLAFGRPLSFRSLRLVPVDRRDRGIPTVPRDFLTLDHREARSEVRVGEVSSGGRVSRLMIENLSRRPLFVPDGTTLRGHKQDRVLNVSVVIAPRGRHAVPVSCVEKGRWSPGAGDGGGSVQGDIELRTLVNRSLIEEDIDQATIWSHVDDLIMHSGARSRTSAYRSVYERCERETGVYGRHLKCPSGASGVVVQLEGVTRAVDIFQTPGMLTRLWPKLAASYALGAIQAAPEASGDRTPPLAPETIGPWMREVLAGVAVRGCAMFGSSRTYILGGKHVVGSACFWKRDLVHLALFHPVARRDQGGGPGRCSHGQTDGPRLSRPDPSNPRLARVYREVTRLLGDRVLSQVAIFKLHGWRDEDIAESLDLSRRSVKRTLSLIRRRLRARRGIRTWSSSATRLR